MTGLDGFAWLNLFGLLLLWTTYWIADQLRDPPAYERGLHHATVAVAIFFVVADAKHWLSEEPGPMLQASAVLLLAVTAWELFAGLFMPSLDSLGRVGDEAVDLTASANERVTVADLRPSVLDESAACEDDGYLDLDAGTPHSAENREKMAGAIGELMGPRSTAADRVRAFGTLFGDADPEEDDESDVPYLIITFLLLVAVLGHPCWIALRLLS